MKRFYRIFISTLFVFICVFGMKFVLNGISDDQIIRVELSKNLNITLNSVYLLIVTGIISAIIGYYLLAPQLIRFFTRKIILLEELFNGMTLSQILILIGGLVVGLIIANLIGIPFLQYRLIGTIIIITLGIVLGYMGIRMALQINKSIITSLTKSENRSKPKILDTSVIIDGRILDILKTGFIEGKVIIPQFVLRELRHIADSADSLKRNRGRRGLDILNEIQKQLKVKVEITEKDYKNISEVDSKLLKLAEDMNAAIVTNDFNLNKVADFKGVLVLNINELSNAIKPVVLPGEDMTVTVIKDGKEHEQGIAYLNDGTMIVVEGGRRSIGKTIEVLVTSVLQTAAGRMIFTKLK